LVQLRKKARSRRAEIHFLEEMEETEPSIPKKLCNATFIAELFSNPDFTELQLKKPGKLRRALVCKRKAYLTFLVIEAMLA
jgi:hypothetical protein